MTTISQPGYFTKDEIGEATRGFYAQNGYLVLVDGLSSAEVRELNEEGVALCRGERGDVNLLQWKADAKSTEPGVELPTPEEMHSWSDDEVLQRFLCIHHPHKCSPLIARCLSHPSIVGVLTNII